MFDFLQNGNFWAYLGIAVAVIFSGMGSAKGVGLVGVSIVAKRPDQVAKAIVSAALVETYAILAFLISMLLIFNMPF